MKVIHVVARMITGSSGPSYSVPSLCKALAQQGAEVELHMVGDAPELDPSIKVVTYPGVPFFSKLGVSPQMKRGLVRAARTADIIHSHSLWMMPNIYPLTAADQSERCKLVVSPRGTLSDWALARSRLRKKAIWHYGQKAVLQKADCLHATAGEELQEIRRLGLDADVAVIPNGIDLPDTMPANGGASTKRRRMLFLSRIHPKKGVDQLLTVWGRISEKFPDWELVIAGPLDGGFSQKMKQTAADMKLPRVMFPGELVGDAKTRMYSQSDCFVLPTHSENFGMVVAESLAHATPAIVSKGAPWGGLQTQECGWWIDQGEVAIEGAMVHAMSQPRGQLAAMGENGQRWMKSNFSWLVIANQMMRAYQWLVNKSNKPEWIDSVR